MKASGVEAEDQTSGSAVPISAGGSPAGSFSAAPSSPVRANKMDSFFAQAAAEEKAAAEELAAGLAVESENAGAETHDATEPAAAVAHQQEVTDDQTIPAETTPEPPLNVPPAEPRPTGYAGLTAGLAAAGMGNLGMRLAEESTSTAGDAPVVEEPQTSAARVPMPSPPIIPVVEPSFSAHNFDLEAARLEDVSGPVFSQEFEEKEPSPEDRLANRLRRENLLSQGNQRADQPLNPPLVSPDEETALDQGGNFDQNANVNQSVVHDQATAEGDGALFADPTHETAQIVGDSEPIADLFVEIPQMQQPSEMDHVDVDHQSAEAQQIAPVEESPPHTIDKTLAEDSQLHPPTAPVGNYPPVASTQMMPEPPLPSPMPTNEAPVDPRLLEAKRLEEEFRQLQDQEKTYADQALQEQLKHERTSAENTMLGEREAAQQLAEKLAVEQQAAEDRSAAIEQAERVKAARKKADQASRDSEPVISPAVATDEPSDVQEQIKTDPQLPARPNDVQSANESVLIPPGTLQRNNPPSVPQPSAADKQHSKRGSTEQQFPFGLFYARMLEHLSDGVVFVDHKARVKMWSRGAEKATGIVPGVVIDRPLLPQTINLCDTEGNGLQLDKCPVTKSLRTLEIVTGEYKITNNTSPRGMKVELTVIPVIDTNRYVNGAVVMFHDRTAQVNLQRQLKDLYEFSVLDPLTQVANRAEFERVQQEYVLAFQQSDDFNCSIIICDIDYFKSINDNFGHTVGDEALMSFAEMLKRYVRPQDLVARYGGEEFVILCADCDTAAAVQRAEEIRMALYKTPQPMLEGKSISASFGVSELREGDTATDFFVRADTALLKAKETGRNRVVAGDGSTPTGTDESATELSPTGIRWKAQQRKKTSLICEEFKTETPIQVLVEKLRGFIIENDALLQRVEPEFLSMEVEVEAPMDYSRKGAFTMNVEFKETEPTTDGASRTKTLNYIRVTIYAGRMKNWFSTNHTDLAPHLLGELRRFLMIGDKASRLSVDLATENVR